MEGLESFLLGRLQRRNEFENNRMRMVMTRLLQCRGMFNVEQLASYACLSRKYLSVCLRLTWINAETILTGDSFSVCRGISKSNAGG
ncbi:MAG: hypothetical protein ACLU4J_21485 [Butyricimonas paravirosa]